MPLKKIGRAIKKTVRKVVPKEIGGILQVAAPFVAAGPAGILGGLATSLAGQLRTGQGRINPFSTLAAIAPSQQFRGFTRGLPGGTRLDEFLYGTKGRFADVQGPTLPVFGDDPTQVTALGRKFIPETQGILGIGGDFGLKEFTKGSLLSPKGELSKSRVFGLIASGATLAKVEKKIDQDGEAAGLGPSELDFAKAEAAEIFKDFDTTAFRPQVTAAIGGLMRKNLREGSKGEGDELPPDPTTPVNPFKPKPIGPVLPSKEMASDEISIDQIEMLIKRGADNDLIKEFTGASDGVIDQIRDAMKRKDSAAGGLMRTNYALGTRPTVQESGLGGLPIEADMRYSGGFMPYGAKEKADDVPARLSKNEFVFTADAVRAAGGGSINKGAKRMYNTMKQLESMGRA